MYKITKRCITLIEIMIVMFLISLIIGILAYNYQGSLEKGKIFKTEAGIEKVRTILTLDISEHPEHERDLSTRWKEYLNASPYVQKADDLAKDGWGVYYHVNYNESTNNIEVKSDKLDKIKQAGK